MEATVEVYLDDLRTDAAAHGAPALGVVVDRVKADLAARGRILVGIHCDGLDVTGDDFDAALTRPIASFGRIELYSAEPDALVSDALATASDMLEQSRAAMAETSDLLAQGKAEAALTRLGECCRTWIEVHQCACNAIGMLEIDAESMRVDGQSLQHLAALPIDRLGQIKETIAAQDFVLLGDILTYEFPEALDAWSKLLAALGERVANPELNA